MSRDARPRKSSPVATAKDFLTGGGGEGDGEEWSVPELGAEARRVRVRGGGREGRLYRLVRLGKEEEREW